MKINKLIIIISLVGFISIQILFLFSKMSYPYTFLIVKNVDSVIFNQSDPYRVAGKNLSTNDVNVTNPEQDWKKILEISNKIVSYPVIKDNVVSFNLPNELEGLKLLSNLNENSYLSFKYNETGNELIIFTPSYKLQIGNSTIITNEIILQTLKNVQKNSYILFNNQLINSLEPEGGLFRFKDIKNSVGTIFSLKSQNLLDGDNYSFENSLWEESVGNCSNYLPGDPQIKMELSNDSKDGENSLELSSKNHHSCTKKVFEVIWNDSNLYQFNFSYKAVEGKSIKYFVRLSNPNGEAQEIYETIQVDNQNWNNYSKLIQPNIQAPSKFEVYLYAISDNGASSVNRYDNITLSEYSPEYNFSFSEDNLKQNIEIANLPKYKEFSNTVYFSNNNINLLNEQNSSFETGMWSDKPGNCSNMDPGEPGIEMSLTSESTDGNNGINLKSSNHLACTDKIFQARILPDRLYNFSFDYKINSGNNAKYYYSLIGDSQNEIKYKDLTSYSKNWQNINEQISTNLTDVSNIHLYLYSRHGDNTYDNIVLKQVYPKSVKDYRIEYSNKIIENFSNTIITPNFINRWKTEVKVQNLLKPELLVFEKKYDSKMNIYVHNEKKFFNSNSLISKSLHFLANGHYNSWLIDPVLLCSTELRPKSGCTINSDGSYNINFVIEEIPNRLLNFGQLMFGIVLISSTILYLNNSLRIHRIKNKKRLLKSKET